MKMLRLALWLTCTGMVLWACNPATQSTTNTVAFTVLQLNDVYEIAPLQGGKVGGMARVKTIKRQLLQENPNLITVMAGDFISPSLIGTLKVNGQKIAGLQMIEVMNAIGFDYVTFGNHEFDNSYAALQRCVDQSQFIWTSANTFYVDSAGAAPRPFNQSLNGLTQPMPQYVLHTFENAAGQKAKVALFGVTLPFNQAYYVHYDSVPVVAAQMGKMLQDSAQVVLALTHLEYTDDVALGPLMPNVPLIMGGHDHVNMRLTTAVPGQHVVKADANAKTVYVHRCTYNLDTQELSVDSELVSIDDTVPKDDAVQQVVTKWQSIADSAMQQMGYSPNSVVLVTQDTLDGREQEIRYHPTNLGQMFVQSFLAMDSSASFAVMNSGSVRLDDELMGTITQTDILRSLPYGGAIVKSTLTGAQVQTLLNTGLHTNIGLGGYLQTQRVAFGAADSTYVINGQPLEAQGRYTVLMPKFLAQGNEANLEFLANVPFTEATDYWGGTVKNDVRDIAIAWFSTINARQEAVLE